MSSLAARVGLMPGTTWWRRAVHAIRKRDRLLEDSGMKLRRKPAIPRERTWILVASGNVQPDWEPYLTGSMIPAAETMSA